MQPGLFSSPPQRRNPLCPTRTARDTLLALNPLSKPHVVAVNQAEAQFWQRSQGVKVDWSDRILGFECGGETPAPPTTLLGNGWEGVGHAPWALWVCAGEART